MSALISTAPGCSLECRHGWQILVATNMLREYKFLSPDEAPPAHRAASATSEERPVSTASAAAAVSTSRGMM